MPKRIKGLTVAEVQAARKPGMVADGHGLYLSVGPNAKSWIYRYKINGRSHDMGLGSADMVTLKEARDRAHDLYHDVHYKGIDPLEAKRLKRAERRKMITFKEAAERHMAIHMRGRKDKKGWPDSMRLYVYPFFGDVPVDRVDDSHVLACLEAIWTTKTTIASATRSKIETVLNFAASPSMKYRDPNAVNPASWIRLKDILPSPRKISKVKHRDSLPWQECPALMAAVKLDTTNVAAALAFIILAGVRIGEAVNATWAEIDFPGRLWTIPAERMGKTDEEHRVPLSGPALEILRLMAQRKSNTNDFVFQAKYGDKVMNRSGVQVALKRIRPGVTVHGFRTTFRTWCADHDRPREHAEMSLAHLVGSAVERSYQRSDLLDKRRKLMEDWGNYVTGRTF